MFDIAGTVELGKICPGTGTWNRLQDGTKALCKSDHLDQTMGRLNCHRAASSTKHPFKSDHLDHFVICNL